MKIHYMFLISFLVLNNGLKGKTDHNISLTIIPNEIQNIFEDILVTIQNSLFKTGIYINLRKKIKNKKYLNFKWIDEDHFKLIINIEYLIVRKFNLGENNSNEENLKEYSYNELENFYKNNIDKNFDFKYDCAHKCKKRFKPITIYFKKMYDKTYKRKLFIVKKLSYNSSCLSTLNKFLEVKTFLFNFAQKTFNLFQDTFKGVFNGIFNKYVYKEYDINIFDLKYKINLYDINISPDLEDLNIKLNVKKV